MESLCIDSYSSFYGNWIKINVKIKNIGNEKSWISKVNYYISDVPNPGNGSLKKSEIVWILGPGESSYESVYIRIPGNLKDGKYYIVVVADSNNWVDESNESNNYGVIEFQLGD